MDYRETIMDFIYRLETIPVGHESLLKEYLNELRALIQSVYSPQSQYLSYLQFIKFKPDTVFITDKERERSWQDGVIQVDNLLRVLLNDPRISAQSSLSVGEKRNSAVEESIQQSLGELNQSIIQQQHELQKNTPSMEEEKKNTALNEQKSKDGVSSNAMQEAISRSLDGLQQSIAHEHPEWKDQIVDLEKADTKGNSHSLQEIENTNAIQGLQKVLCVTCSDNQLNAQVLDFLQGMQIEVVTIPHAQEQETLMDRINRCLEVDFVVFILSADFHMYARGQRPVDASLVSSQGAVFQLGYLAAKCDRNKIVVLYQEETEFLMPTEFFDLFYIPITSAGVWKEEVIRRMKGNRELSESLGLSKEH